MMTYKIIITFADGETSERKYTDYDKARNCYIEYSNLKDKNEYSIASVKMIELPNDK